MGVFLRNFSSEPCHNPTRILDPAALNNGKITFSRWFCQVPVFWALSWNEIQKGGLYSQGGSHAPILSGGSGTVFAIFLTRTRIPIPLKFPGYVWQGDSSLWLISKDEMRLYFFFFIIAISMHRRRKQRRRKFHRQNYNIDSLRKILGGIKGFIRMELQSLMALSFYPAAWCQDQF